MAEIAEALETVENRRCRLQAEIARRLAMGQTRLRIAIEMRLRTVVVERLAPNPNRRAILSPSIGYRAPLDKNLQNAFRKCDRCGRLGIQPCSRCDPNQ